MKKQLLKILLLPFLVLSLTACLEDSATESGTEIDIVEPSPIVPPDPGIETGDLICNPFDQGDSENRTQGVISKLHYLEDGQPHYNFVQEYLDFGVGVDEVDIYLNQIYIPTRPFDRGFVTNDGTTISTLAGDTLYEWFALSMRGEIKLSENESPGLYQFAILSDDGAVLRIDGTNGMEELIDNDGFHPTRMGCAVDPVYMDETMSLPFELDYFQGPRYHISVILMWRPWTGDPNDPYCGQQGNSLYFDSTQDPVTQNQGYIDLLANGWLPLAPENYQLPMDEGENPCNAPAPTISNFVQSENSFDRATFTWVTDVASTSKLVYQNLATMEMYETAETSSYVFGHEVEITGLMANTLYSVKAVSTSTSGLSSESSELIFRTERLR